MLIEPGQTTGTGNISIFSSILKRLVIKGSVQEFIDCG